MKTSTCVDEVMKRSLGPPSCRVRQIGCTASTYDIEHLISRVKLAGLHVMDEPLSWVTECCEGLQVITWVNWDEASLYTAGPKLCPKGGLCAKIDSIFTDVVRQLRDVDMIFTDEEFAEAKEWEEGE